MRRRAVGRGSPDLPGMSKSEDQLAEAVVTALGAEGDGIATVAGDGPAGGRIHVPFAAPGDRILIARDRNRPDEGRLARLVEAGPTRAAAPCPHFGPAFGPDGRVDLAAGACGGCQVQHLSARAYRSWKAGLLENALARAGLTPETVETLITVPPDSRRRVRFEIRVTGRGPILGFYEKRSHRIVDLGICRVARPEIQRIMPGLRRIFGAVVAAGGTGTDGAATVTLLDDGLDIVIHGTAPLGPLVLQDLATFAETEDLARLWWQQSGDTVIHPVALRRAGLVRWGGVAVTVPPAVFLQASADAEAVMADAVLAATRGAGAVADLFAGAGAFAFRLAAAGKKVVAWDSNRAAIEAVQAGARAGGLVDRLKGAVRDLYRNPVAGSELNGFDAAVFDPPRAGARDTVAALASSTVKRIVAVSCNPASFVRDARILTAGGYRLRTVRGVDQFQWTPHLELVAMFER